MAPATDSAKTSPVRRPWFGIALVTVFLGAGCTQIRAFRKGDDRPVFGTETADNPKGSGSRGSSSDVYVDRLRQTGPARPSLAQRLKDSGSSPRGDDAADSGRDEGPQVVLLPPVSISAPNGANESPAAERSESVPEFRASTTRLDLEPRAPKLERASVESAPGTLRASRPTLTSLLTESRQRLEGLASYQVMMNHQERVGTVLNPAEDVQLSVRRDPKAIRLEWPKGAHKGREVLYEPGRGGLMHVNMGDSPIPVPRLSMKPDSPLALRNSRHPISEAGFSTILENMELALERQQSDSSSAGQISYKGLEQPEALDAPAHKIVRVTATQETWVVYLDTESRLPVFVQANAGNGELLERYVFHDLKIDLPELASAQAFDPDARWGAPKSLLQRLARAGADNAKPSEPR